MQRGPDWTWGDDVDANTFLRHLFRQTPAVVQYRRLSGGVIEQMCARLIGLNRRGGHNAGTGRQERNRLLGDPEKRQYVHRIGLFELLGGQIGNLLDGDLLPCDQRQRIQPA
ncbi:hypothetical protein D3C76_1567500 [compost metagenome]